MYTNASGRDLKLSATPNSWPLSSAGSEIRTGSGKNDIFYSNSTETLLGLSGDDTYQLWNIGAVIQEQASHGIDTAVGCFWGEVILPDNVENLILKNLGATSGVGNILDNILMAGNSGATLFGMGGDDVLVGGAGADVFRICAGSGNEEVVEFQPGWDALQLEGFGVSSFAELMCLTEQVGSDVRIDFTNGEMLLLRGVNSHLLEAADFNFFSNLRTPATEETHLIGPTKVLHANGWNVINNAYGSGNLKYGDDYSLESVSSREDMTGGTDFSWAYPLTTKLHPQVLAYPEVQYGFSPKGINPTMKPGVLPVVVSDVLYCDIRYDVEIEGHTSGFNVAYDIWFTNKPFGQREDITNEIMIWVHKGAALPPGKVVGRYDDGSFVADVYHDGNLTALVMDADCLVGTIKLRDVIDYLIDLKIVKSTEYLAAIELGSEVFSGAGQLSINNLDFTLAKKNADGGVDLVEVTGEDTTVTKIVSPNLTPNSHDLVDKPSMNTAPVAVSASFVGTEDASLMGKLLASDTDSDVLSYELVSSVAGVTLATDGTISYQLVDQAMAAGTNQIVTFQYTASDGLAKSNPATVSLTINGANDAPIANDDEVNIKVVAGEPITLTVATLLNNDTDVDRDDTIRLELVHAQGEHGSLSLDANGVITFTPAEPLAADHILTDTFNYKVVDKNGAEDIAKVTLNLSVPNTAPTAQAFNVTGTDASPVTGSLSNFASDVNGDNLQFALVRPVEGLTLDADTGAFSYAPDTSLAAGVKQTVTFQYTVSDGTATTKPATASLVITGQNDVIRATDDIARVTALAGKPITLTTASLLLNDNDPDKGDTKSFVGVVDKPDNGTLALKSGVLTYVPNSPVPGGTTVKDTFTYQVRDSAGSIDTAEVTLWIKGPNTAATAPAGQTFTGSEGEIITGQLRESDPDADDLISFKLARAIPGLILDPNGSFAYTPDGKLGSGATGNVSFQFTVSDGGATSRPITATIKVAGLDDAPEAQNDTIAYAGKVGAALSITAASLLKNDINLDKGDVLALADFDDSEMRFGTITRSGVNLSFKPDMAITKIGAGKSLTDSFEYTVSDKAGQQDTAVATLTLGGEVASVSAALKLGAGANLVTIDLDALSNVTASLEKSRVSVISGFTEDDTIVFVAGSDDFQVTDSSYYVGLDLKQAANQAALLIDDEHSATSFEVGETTFIYSDTNGSHVFDKGDGLVQITGVAGLIVGDDLILT